MFMASAKHDPLLEALHAALEAQGYADDLELERLPDKGLAHDHVRLVGQGLLARVPKQSQIGLAAVANLDYQAACFERAAASGHTPRLHGRIEPTAAGTPLARGSLLVQEIAGEPAALPAALPALVDALAAIHRLPLPPQAQRAPLFDAPDALAALDSEIDNQALHLPAAKLAPEALHLIERVHLRWRRLLAQPARPARRLITFDAHPGNFLVTPEGRAVIVDLEKVRYSHPPLDLAHATLYTSTTWDVASRAELSLAEVSAACERWLDAMGAAHEPPPWIQTSAPGTAHGPWQPWIVPLREAMWLWAVTWCAKWRVVSGAPARPATDGEDWSAARSDAALITHVRSRVDEYLSPRGVGVVVEECEALRRYFGTV